MGAIRQHNANDPLANYHLNLHNLIIKNIVCNYHFFNSKSKGRCFFPLKQIFSPLNFYISTILPLLPTKIRHLLSTCIVRYPTLFVPLPNH